VLAHFDEQLIVSTPDWYVVRSAARSHHARALPVLLDELTRLPLIRRHLSRRVAFALNGQPSTDDGFGFAQPFGNDIDLLLNLRRYWRGWRW
jgi:hypothetical protein